MPLYTFIMEYKGGTYISQIESSSLLKACVKWANNLKASEIYGFGQSSKQNLIEKIKSENPVLLDGLKNIWCVSVFIRGESALINIVLTETTNNEQPTMNN